MRMPRSNLIVIQTVPAEEEVKRVPFNPTPCEPAPFKPLSNQSSAEKVKIVLPQDKWSGGGDASEMLNKQSKENKGNSSVQCQ